MDSEDGHGSLNVDLSSEDVVSVKDGKCTRRIARFLRPFAQNQDEAAAVPKTPLLAEMFTSDDQRKWPSKISFKRTNKRKGWEEWVDRLAFDYAAIWNQTGICDAIMGSMYEVCWNQNLVLGLVEFWCPETNTFVFPWGEATITLEDVMILGGFPVSGEPISSSVTVEESKLAAEMAGEKLKLQRTRAKKATFSGWLDLFKEGDSEFEHMGFLSLWLSSHVFHSDNSVKKHVFPLAAKLSRRRKLALAPAVLAGLYMNLTLLSTLLRDMVMNSSESVIMARPFQFLILWAFEHFPRLAPLPNTLKPGEPRVARWHRVSVKLTVGQVKSAFMLAESFEWRPYAADCENWHHLSYYRETEQLLPCSSLQDEEMESYFQCLRPCELVGLDCRRMYQPQRVAMQFGMDQDLPLPANSCCAIDSALERSVFFVPPRSFSPGVSKRYYNWWKESMSARESAIKNMLDNLRRDFNGSQNPEENCGSLVVIGNRKRNLAGKCGYDDEQDEAKRKARGSAGNPIIIAAELEGKSTHNEDPGKSVGNPILIY